MTMTISAAAIWVFAYVNTQMGRPLPIVGGYGPQFTSRGQCVAKLPTYGNWLVCVRIPGRGW